jgi:hypothetical protein
MKILFFMTCTVTAEAVCGTAVRMPHCYSHGWQDCETGVVVLLAVENSRAGLNYSK